MLWSRLALTTYSIILRIILFNKISKSLKLAPRRQIKNMTNLIRTDGNRVVNVIVEVDLYKQGDFIVSYCQALELSSFGLTENEAKEGFEGALETFIKDTHEKGTLERVLLDLGWSLTKVKYQPPINKVRTKARKTSLIRTFKEKVAIPIH